MSFYFDHHATTPCDKRVCEAMDPFLKDCFGNPASVHQAGKAARNAVENAREQVATLLGCDSKEVYFTSGATESNNWAIKGAATGTILTAASEHKCVLEAAKFTAAMNNQEIEFLTVDHSGHIDLGELEDKLKKSQFLALMGANNEIGTICDFREIGSLCKKYDVHYHIDGAQTAGKTPFSVKDAKAATVSMSGHKIYGPKGIGALFIREDIRDNVKPLLHGGMQERGKRAGTLPTALIVGLGKASELAHKELDQEIKHLSELRDLFLSEISEITDISINGDMKNRLAGNLNIEFKNIDRDLFPAIFKDIYVSSGSACSSGSPMPSYVLKAIGKSDDEATASVRFGFGRSNTAECVKEACQLIKERIERLCC